MPEPSDAIQAYHGTSLADLVVCELCGGEVVRGSVCPLSLACPVCVAKPGAKCRRPSGHRAAVMHAPRYLAAEKIDRAAGLFA